jgi:membrane protein
MFMYWFSILKAAGVRFYNHDAGHLAAALAYYTPFALTPLILISVTVLSYVYGSSYAVDMLMIWGSVLGPEMLSLLSEAIARLRETAGDFSIPVVGSLFFFAMIVVAFNALSGGFDQLWEVSHRGLSGWLQRSWRSVVFIFVLQAYLIVIMGVDSLVLAYSDATLMPLVAASIGLIATTWLFYLAYRFLPVSPHSRRSSFYGAVVASLLLGVAKSLISLYIASAAVPKLYDAAGLIVALLIWIYSVAAIVYFGAIVVHEADRARGIIGSNQVPFE